MAVFALSGFSGLIYQSIWSHYLGLTLGHAAYAQTLVLAIYMGGLALGSWLASRWVTRLADAIRAYAGVELAIGACALLFHPLFLAYTGLSQETVLPQLSGGAVHAYQWGTAALLILPQCILLGTTFPLMAAGCLRLPDSGEGRSLGGLYFTNSLGAAMGALVATFVLLPRIGMPGAMTVAGIINLVVAAIAWRLSSPSAVRVASASTPAQSPRAAGSALLRGVLLAAAITGATSFVYEIVWVRMLNTALGTTLHSFELMLAAFILGLAAGAWWIHRRGDRSTNTLRLAGIAQVLMGLCALGSALAFSQAFHGVAWLVNHLPKTDLGYLGFNLGSAAIAMLVMFPTAFFAGSTLPLFTMSLLRRGEDERVVGWVYAANTLGAIIGVFAVVHLLIPAIGLHLSLLLAAVADLALGVVLLNLFAGGTAPRDRRLAMVASLSLLSVVLVYGRPDPLAQASGVFRRGYLMTPKEAKILFMADGKTSTVSVLETYGGALRTISTNGKPDAGLVPSLRYRATGDEVTMIMLGALGLALHPAPSEVGIIGWGSGLTTHTVLGSGAVRRVDTIEIEPEMYLGAQALGTRALRAYRDPRSKVVFDDARTYFAAGRKQYDLLISEPSNPWVSGVASLFTEEFYGFLRGHLRPGGIFVQWVQAYEMNDELQARIISAMLDRFPHVDAYLTNQNDLLFAASETPLPPLDYSRLQYSPLNEELARVALARPSAFTVRRIGGREVLAAYARSQESEGHSDFHPVVALGAPKARFLDESALLLPLLVEVGMPVLDLLDGRRPIPRHELDPNDDTSNFVRSEVTAGAIVDAFRDGAALSELRTKSPQRAGELQRVLAESARPIPRLALPTWSSDLATLARHSLGALPPQDLRGSWIEPVWMARGQGPEVAAVMAAYRAAAERNAGAMRARASEVLALRAGLADEMRQQMLLIALAGAAGERDYEAMRALEQRHGAGMAQDDDYASVRGFLAAWSTRTRTASAQ